MVNTEMPEYRKGSHTIYDLKYHIVWITLVSANVAQEQGQREHFLPFAPGGLWVNGQ
jgi:hypothetical protein